MAKKVRYEEMLPHEMKRVVASKPIVYVPCGTLEWHGVHLALGNDAVKAHELSLRCAQKSGGVVTPANYWAMGGLHQPWTVRSEPENLQSILVVPILENVYRELERIGFGVIITITGHYGMGQLRAVKKAALSQMYNGGAIVYAFPEYEVVADLGYHGDHAAKWETSILWALRPELVEMDRLPKDMSEPLVGVGGQDPRTGASRKLGREIVKAMVERIAAMAEGFLAYNAERRREFLKACERQYEFLSYIMRGGRADPEIASKTHGPRRKYLEEVLPAFCAGDYAKAMRLLDGLSMKLARVMPAVEPEA